MSRPLGSAPTPASRGFTATTSRSAGGRRNGTQCLRLAASARSLSPGRGPLVPICTSRRVSAPPSHVPCRSSRPGSRRLLAGHHLANTRAPARLVPGAMARPLVSMPTEGFDGSTDDASPTRRRRSGASSWPPPDVSSTPFPCRSLRRSSANAAQGGLAPVPVDRRRRAYLHLLHSSASVRASYMAPPSAT